jgi:hypothetical protein
MEALHPISSVRTMLGKQHVPLLMELVDWNKMDIILLDHFVLPLDWLA